MRGVTVCQLRWWQDWGWGEQVCSAEQLPEGTQSSEHHLVCSQVASTFVLHVTDLR